MCSPSAGQVALREGFGSLEVKELDWTKPEQLDNFDTAYDFVIGTDCVRSLPLQCPTLQLLVSTCTAAAARPTAPTHRAQTGAA